MFEITDQPIQHELCASKIEDERAGAMVFFDGRVRNHNNGDKVSSLKYQCYKEMALKEGATIISEALSRFDIHHAYSVHREGHLNISEIAVWVGVSSSHRQEAFDACQYIIDEIKQRVPMWKKEHYVDHPAKWSQCHRCHKDLNNKNENLHA